MTNCTFSGNSDSFSGGGGMYNSNSSPTVTNCTFSNNTAANGGGMFNNASSPTVTNTGFCSNTPDAINGDYTDGGGNSLEYCAPPIPPPETCPADLDGSGNVNPSDLAQLLGSWGPCP